VHVITRLCFCACVYVCTTIWGDRLALDVGIIVCYPSAQVGRVCVCVSACNNSFVFVFVYVCTTIWGDRLALEVGIIACYPSAQIGRVCECM